MPDGCAGAGARGRCDVAHGERQGLGWTLAEPLEASLVHFLPELDPTAYESKRRSVSGMSRALFVDVDDTRTLLERLDKLAGVAA